MSPPDPRWCPFCEIVHTTPEEDADRIAALRAQQAVAVGVGVLLNLPRITDGAT